MCKERGTFHIEELANKAEKLYRKVKKKNFEELKMIVLEQEAYQLSSLYKYAGADWKPSQKIKDAVVGKKLVNQYLPTDIFMSSLEQYKDIFGINIFEKEIMKKASNYGVYK